MPATSSSSRTKSKMPELDDFLANGDYTGAVTLLDFQQRTGDDSLKSIEWLAYSAFHNGDYKRALQAYTDIVDSLERDGGKSGPSDGSLDLGMATLCIAACHYFMGNYEQAEKSVAAGPDCPLKNRLLFHLAHRQGNEQTLMQLHQRLGKDKESQLALAAMHYLRSHYQEATDIYKRLLLENRDDVALNQYIASCYYRLDYYDVSLEILGVYLQSRPTSPAAINLKACNHFKLYNGKAAEAELKTLADQGYPIDSNPLMRHNMVVFRSGEGALRVLPPLLSQVPEARMNLVIYHLKQGAVADAFALLKDVEPSSPSEFILKAVVNAAVGQRSGSREHLKTAQQYFNLVGASASECDTIPGRQSMASCFFLMRQFEDVNIYLSSIKPYLHNDDDFNWNYGLTLAAIGNYKEAEDTLLLVSNPASTSDYVYMSWLARCYIMNRKARQAWELYLRMDTSPESLSLLQLIANDCYRTGAFYWSAKAFDVLERLDPDPEYWEGKRGACMGVFQAVVAGQEGRDSLRDVVAMLRNTANAQVEYILRVIGKWAQANGGL